MVAYIDGRNVNEGNRQADIAAKDAAEGDGAIMELPDGADGGVFSLHRLVVSVEQPAVVEWKALSTRHGRAQIYDAIVSK